MTRVMRWGVVGVCVAFSGCKRGQEKSVTEAGTPAPAATVAVAAGGATYVWDPNTVVFDEAKRGANEIERIPVGAKVVVERLSSTPEYVQVVDGTKKRGFVLARAVRAGKPDAAVVLGEAKTKLGTGDLAGARAEAERGLALHATHAETFDLLEAIYDAQGDLDAAKALRERRKTAKIPAPTPTPDAAQVASKAPDAGDVRWVSATKLLLKEKPDVSAKTVAELPINTKVKVVEKKGEWVLVEATLVRPSLLRVDLTGEGKVSTLGGDTRVARGFARPRFLSDAELTFAGLVAEADAFEKKGELTEAVRRLERAAAVDPDPKVVQRLAATAGKAKLWRIAARAAARLTQAPGGGSGEALVSDVTKVWGCRGDLTRAVLVDYSGARSAPKDACVVNVPTHDECAPCGPSGITVSEEESSTRFEDEARAQIESEGIEDPERIAEIMEEARRGKEEAVAEAQKTLVAEEADHRAALEEWEKDHTAWQLEQDAFRQLFPEGPFVQVTIPASAKPLYVWSRGAQVLDDYCGNLILGWSGTSVSNPIEPDAERDRSAWVVVGSTDLEVYGVSDAPPGDPEGMPPSEAFPGLKPCGCCGC